MTKTRTGRTTATKTTADAVEHSVTPLRIDPPHGIAGQPSAGQQAASALTVAEELIAAELSSVNTALGPLEELAQREEQLQHQAAQLAGHLKQRLNELDRREAQLNARIAQLEADLRSARLWHREREHDFQQREMELCRQVEDLQARAAEVARGEEHVQTLDERSQQIIAREQELKALDLQLRQRRQELDRQTSAFTHAQSLWQLQLTHESAAFKQEQERAKDLWQREVEQQQQQLEFEMADRRRKVETAEREHREAQARLDQDRADFERQRIQGTAQVQRERAAWDELRGTADLEILSRRREIESRESIVERQRVAMEQMRTEIASVHRQSLEMRLIAEQLWAQITGRLSSAEITRSIASLRLQLSQQYEQEQKALTKQKDELVQLADRLQAQHALLNAERQEVKNWGAARQAGIEQQARQLVEREQQLETEQQELRGARQTLAEDRRRYEEEIRDLTRQLHSATQPSAA